MYFHGVKFESGFDDYDELWRYDYEELMARRAWHSAPAVWYAHSMHAHPRCHDQDRMNILI